MIPSCLAPKRWRILLAEILRLRREYRRRSPLPPTGAKHGMMHTKMALTPLHPAITVHVAHRALFPVPGFSWHISCYFRLSPPI